MQRTHSPQVFFSGASGSSGMSVITCARNTHEPWLCVRDVGVLAEPADTCAGRSRAVVHWSVVNENASADRAPCDGWQLGDELAETLLDDIVVVVAPCVAGYLAAGLRIRWIRLARVVAECERYDRFRAFEKFLRTIGTAHSLFGVP